LGIVWDKKNALQVEHLKQATEKKSLNVKLYDSKEMAN
jgi:hypothetical protein